MGTSDTFIDLSIFDTYQRIQKKVSKYRTSKVLEDRISDHQISTFDSPMLSDTEKISEQKTKKMALYSPFSTKKNIIFIRKKANPPSPNPFPSPAQTTLVVSCEKGKE
jgi:hypothetical protein